MKYQDLYKLAEEWEEKARRALIRADHQKGHPLEEECCERPPAWRFFQHSAFCYMNCASELKEFLSSLELSSLAIEKEHQK